MEMTTLILRRLMSRMIQYFEAGLITPITPIKAFPAAEIADAFRYLQNGSHIGKIVVNIPKSIAEELSLENSVEKLQLHADFSYLLVGGFGGLGRATASWMVENGARHLIFLSRDAGKSENDQAFVRELEYQGCNVQVFAGSVVNLGDVANLVQKASKPIKGVIQMAMVIRNQDFLSMKHEEWEAVILPKVQGSWNLHQALPKNMDFFVATASISGTFGYYGQANYAAGNTFLDALVSYRNNVLNLPAAVIDLGAVAEIGYMKENFADQEMYRLSGNHYIYEQAFLDSIHWAIRKCDSRHADGDGRNHIVIGLRSKMPLSDPQNRIPWKRDARVGIYYNLNSRFQNEDASHATCDTLQSVMSSVEDDPSLLKNSELVETLSLEIGKQIHILMLRPGENPDLSQSLDDLGMDSLIMIEMRSWIRRNIGVEISTLELLSCGTISGVGSLVLERLQRKLSTKEGRILR